MRRQLTLQPVLQRVSRATLGLAIGLGCVSAGAAQAALISVAPVNPSATTSSITLTTFNGTITFRAQGDLTLTGGSGTGTNSDPFVIEENITGAEVILAIEGLSETFKQIVGDPRPGFVLEKRLRNSTNQVWTFFDNELQEVLGTPSPDDDGLSFAQDQTTVRPFRSDKFTIVDEENGNRDFVNFSGGQVNPGETVTIRYAITDASPSERFFLQQRPNFRPIPDPPTKVPEPGVILGLLSVVGMGGWLQRQR